MIGRLRNRFIRLATLSVAAVLLLLTAALNVANYISNDRDLRQTLDLIYENQGTIPVSDRQTPPEPPANGTNGDMPPRRDGPFTQETPFSTRFFVLRYQDDGTLTQAELDRIASVTQDNAGEYLAAAIRHGEGCGYYGSYKFRVIHTGENRNMAIFVDAYQNLRSMRTVLLWSLAADAGCTLLVLLLVVLLSRRAIDPVVRSARQQKQFITDASHELKTPITVIATSLRVLELDTGPQKWIDKARAQTERLTQLVNSLVALSRMDEEDSPLKMEEFPISEAMLETVDGFRDYADAAGHWLDIRIEPGLTYRGDQYAIRQLASILLDNAVKYADPGAPIRLTLEKARRGVVLRTVNACPPMDREQTDKLFDRFYRADPARTAGGFGIGLSLARSIVQGHRGTISARYADGTITFTAQLR